MAASDFDGAARTGAVAVGRLALTLLKGVDRQPPLGGRKLKLRIGIHCGPATAGIIGDTRFSYDTWGEAVNTASRMESDGVPGRIHVSEDFRDLAATDRFSEFVGAPGAHGHRGTARDVPLSAHWFCSAEMAWGRACESSRGTSPRACRACYPDLQQASSRDVRFGRAEPARSIYLSPCFFSFFTRCFW